MVKKTGEDIYELYQGDRLLITGQLREISKITKLHEGTLLNYNYPKYLEKNKDNDVLKLYKKGQRS